jgi:hypothetical protein
MRLLFSSIHCYLDPSSGAALCTRELLEVLASRGMDCRVLTAGVLDHERETTLNEVLGGLELPVQRFQAEPGHGGRAEVIDLNANGMRATILPTASNGAERSPQSAVFLELPDQVLRPSADMSYWPTADIWPGMRDNSYGLRRRAQELCGVPPQHPDSGRARRSMCDCYQSKNSEDRTLRKPRHA